MTVGTGNGAGGVAAVVRLEAADAAAVVVVVVVVVAAAAAASAEASAEVGVGVDSDGVPTDGGAEDFLARPAAAVGRGRLVEAEGLLAMLGFREAPARSVGSRI